MAIKYSPAKTGADAIKPEAKTARVKKSTDEKPVTDQVEKKAD